MSHTDNKRPAEDISKAGATHSIVTDRLREELAAIEHERWADWQKWCHKVLREHMLPVPVQEVLERWDKQINTPYERLSDAEKASDMEQVDRYWPLIDRHVQAAVRDARIDELKLWNTYGHPNFHQTDDFMNRIAGLQADPASSEGDGNG